MTSNEDPQPEGNPADTDHLLGYAAIVLAMAIYASNLVGGRYSVLHGLSSFDLVAVRYLVSGMILLPNFIRLGPRDLGGLGWRKGVVLCCVAGSPYMVILFGGLNFAPATHGAVLNPAIVPSVVFLCMVGLGLQRFTIPKLLALVTIIVGIVMVTGSSFTADDSVLTGDLLLFTTGVGWGVFTLLTRLWNMRALQSATIISVLSMVYLPIYFIWFYDGISSASMLHIVLQTIFQGVIVSIVALGLVTYAVGKLGPQLASLFSPLVPVLTVLLDVFLLEASLSAIQWAGVVIVVAGMLTAGMMNRRR